MQYFFDLFTYALLWRASGPGCYARSGLCLLMGMVLLVCGLLSDLTKIQPNNISPYLPTFQWFFWAGNYGNHAGKIRYEIYLTYLPFRPLLLPKLNKCTMPPRKMHHAPMSSHRPAVFVWDVKCTMGMVHSTLSTVGITYTWIWALSDRSFL